MWIARSTMALLLDRLMLYFRTSFPAVSMFQTLYFRIVETLIETSRIGLVLVSTKTCNPWSHVLCNATEKI